MPRHRAHLSLTPLGFLVAGMLAACAGPALAQYVWLDDKGIKQFSDRPPPASVPDRRILKMPGKPAFNPLAGAAAEAEPADTTADAKPKAAPTLAERNADYAKRRAEAAQAAKKADDEAARKADIAANCEAARNNQRALDQGVRMSTYDKNGDSTVMDEAGRASAAMKNKKILADCK